MSGVDDLEVIAIELVGSGSYYEAACRSVSIKFSRSICLPFSFSVFVGLVGELAPWYLADSGEVQTAIGIEPDTISPGTPLRSTPSSTLHNLHSPALGSRATTRG